MDETIDALASRLNGRHLVDEVLGYFRTNGAGNGHGMPEAKERISDTASTAVRSLSRLVREHPMPAALIGSGVAWMVYDHYRREDEDYGYGYDDDDLQGAFFDDEYYASGKFGSEDEESRMDRLKEEAAEHGSRLREGAEDMVHRTRDKMADASHRLGARSGHARHRARHGMQQARRRATQMRSQARSGARDIYQQGRGQLDQHPLEAGLLSLAGGLIAGLLTPNPTEFDAMAGPAARKVEDRVRRRAHDALDRGKERASAAVRAAQDEAKEQGLTPENLKEGAEKVFQETRHAATETARREADAQGLTPENLKEKAKAVAEESKDAARERSGDSHASGERSATSHSGPSHSGQAKPKVEEGTPSTSTGPRTENL